MAEAITVSGPVSGTDKTSPSPPACSRPQSQGAVVAQIGDTQALVTANGDKDTREGIDFFPLTVDVEEKAYAAGKIPGSFFRREGRPSDNAVLVCRLIDRPLRPSFADGYRNETQVVVTVLGADQENPHDVIAINGASAALMLSGLPFDGPDRRRAPGLQPGRHVDPAPHLSRRRTSPPSRSWSPAALIDDDVAIMMVEAGGTEKAWDYYEAGAPKVTEAVIAEGLEACKTWIRESIALQQRARRQGRRASRRSPGSPSSTTATTSPPRLRRSPRAAWPRPTRSPTRPSATPPTTRSRPTSSAS